MGCLLYLLIGLPIGALAARELYRELMEMADRHPDDLVIESMMCALVGLICSLIWPVTLILGGFYLFIRKQVGKK